jgi:hypothetical protein
MSDEGDADLVAGWTGGRGGSGEQGEEHGHGPSHATARLNRR